MIDMENTQQSLLKITPVLGQESVPILDALGRVLYRDISVSNDHPAADISTLDGFAFYMASLKGVSRQHPVHLQMIGESLAGKPFEGIVKQGQAVRIMTGGVLPEGVDTVIKIEETHEKSGFVICSHKPDAGTGILKKGSSLKKNEDLLYAGSVITPLEIGALACQRRAFVQVHRKPVVAIMATGNELSDFNEPPVKYKTMCSTLYTLAALVKEAGAQPLCLGIARDDLDDQKNLLQQAMKADIIITSGGTSRGKYDLTHKTFFSMGMELQFSNMFAKPGKPTIMGTIDRSLVFGLPGNPSASILSFNQFIKPVLLKMIGHQKPLAILAIPQKNDSVFFHIDSFNKKVRGTPPHKLAPQVPLPGKPDRTRIQTTG